MSGVVKHAYPPLAEVIKAIRESGQEKVAQSLGISPSTLQSFLSKNNVAPEDRRKATRPLLAQDIDAPPDTEAIQAQRIKDLEAALRKRQKVDVFTERVALAVTDAVERRGLPKFNHRVIKKKSPTEGHHEFVLLHSDDHYGEVVSLEETNGLNEYDTGICWKRHAKLRESIFSYADNRPYEVKRLHVLKLGDTLSGNIHGELRETNEIPLAEAVVDYGDKGAEWLDSLSERFTDIRVTGVVGNHPRFDVKPRAKGAFDNADWITYWHMRTVLKNHPGISFNIPKSNAAIHKVFDRNVLLLHGDGIRSSMVGVPWGGIMRRATTLQTQYGAAGIPIDLYTVGHFHQRNVVMGPGGSHIAMNGTIKGIDEYGLKNFGGGDSAGQLLLTYHKDKGLTDVSLIDL